MALVFVASLFQNGSFETPALQPPNIITVLPPWRLYNLFVATSCSAPVTAQIHSLSYPRHQTSFVRTMMLGPGPSDAIFCSSSAGRQALERSFEVAARGVESVG